jgi:hypothetical protein
MMRRWSQARIADLLELGPSIVHRMLTRFGLAHLAHPDVALASRYTAVTRPWKPERVPPRGTGPVP